jgi:hypothetical protein
MGQGSQILGRETGLIPRDIPYFPIRGQPRRGLLWVLVV